MSDNFEFLNNEPLQEENKAQPQQQFIWESPFTPRFTPEEIAKINEKKAIKRAAAALSAPLIFISLFPVILGIVLGIISVFLKENFIEEPAFEQTIQIAFSMLIFTVPFILGQKAVGIRISDLISFKKAEKGLVLPLFFLGISFLSFCNIGAAYIDRFFKRIGIDYSVGESSLPQGIFGFILSFIAVAVVPALVEEFAFRGILLGSLRKFGNGFALIISSICFGFMHGNFEQIPFAFTVGLFLGFTVIKTNSLRIAVVLHFYNNAVSILFSYLPSSLDMNYKNLIYTALLLFSLIIGILFLKNREKDFFSISDVEIACTTGEKYKYFFTSFGIITFVVLSFLEAASFIFLNLLGG